MPTQRSVARSEPVACPICGRSLNWMPDRRLAEFDCETCGPFSDFGGAALASERRHRVPQMSHPHKAGGSKSDDERQDHEDENDSGGEGGGRA